MLNQPDESSFGSVGQMPPVGCEVLPADVLGVVPQGTHLERWIHLGQTIVQKFKSRLKCPKNKRPDLSWGVSGVPQGIPQVLTGTGGGVDNFD